MLESAVGFSPHSAKWRFRRVSRIPLLVGESVALSSDKRATRFPRDAWASGGAARGAELLRKQHSPTHQMLCEP